MHLNLAGEIWLFVFTIGSLAWAIWGLQFADEDTKRGK